MDKTGLIFCNSEKAYIYELHPRTLEPKLISCLEHPESLLKANELSRDQAGHFGPRSDGGHGTFHHNNPRKVEMEKFTHIIAEFIEKLRVENKLQRLILIGEPQFQGHLFEALPKQSQQMVKKRISKDYVSTLDRELDQILEHLYYEIREVASNLASA